METKLIKVRIHIDDDNIRMKIEEQDEELTLFLIENDGFRCPKTGIVIRSIAYPDLVIDDKSIVSIYIRGENSTQCDNVCSANVGNAWEEKQRILKALENLCEVARASVYDWMNDPELVYEF